MNILLTDGENRSTLALTRSLGKKDYRVVVTSSKSPCLASSSKYCALGIAVPDPLVDGKEYAATIRRVAEKNNIELIIPTTEASIYQLNAFRNNFPEGTILACPTEDKMSEVSNKASLFRLAEHLDVPIPKTLYLNNDEDLQSVIDDISEYPVVIKPALSKIRIANGFLSGGIMYASSRRELEKIYLDKRVLKYPSLIQEKIVGPGTGLFSLYDKNSHLALFSHRRLLEKPPSGGISVVSESVPLDEEMVENATKLLSAVGWQGVAMVEFKRDNRDGQAKLMEINGRFWGTLQLAIFCDIDFPRLYLDMLQGRKPAETFKEYKVGHRMKWFFGTLDHLLIRLKNRDKNLNLPPGHPSKWRVMADFLHVWEKDTSFDVLDRKDLRPFLYEAKNYLRGS